MHKFEGARSNTTFAGLEAKISVWRPQLQTAEVRGRSNGLSHLHSWCALIFRHKIEGARSNTPFAGLEAKISVWRPQLQTAEVRGRSNGLSHLHSWCALIFRHKIEGAERFKILEFFRGANSKIKNTHSAWHPLQ